MFVDLHFIGNFLNLGINLYVLFFDSYAARNLTASKLPTEPAHEAVACGLDSNYPNTLISITTKLSTTF